MASDRPTTLRYLWLLSALFVVYGTSIPFEFVWDPGFAAEKLSRIQLTLFLSPETGRRVSIPDVVQNVLLFLPFGAFGVLSAGVSRLSVLRILWVTVLGALLSASVEGIQLFTANRVSSFNDVFTNTTGTLIGALVSTAGARAAVRWVARLKASGLTDAPAAYPMIVATVMLIAAAWQPFDPSLDVGATVGKLRTFVRDPWQVSALTDEALELFRYLLFGAVAGTWLRQLGVRNAGLLAAVVGICAAFGLEGVQLIVRSRMPGLKDAFVHAAGVLAGVGLSRVAIRSPLPWVVGVAIATAIGTAVQMLSPFTIAPAHRPFVWMPFLAYYEFTSTQTVSHVADLVLAYVPFGFALAFVVRSPARLWGAAILFGLLIATPLEYLQGWIVGRYSDVTDLGVAMLGCVTGAWLGGPGRATFHTYVSTVRHDQPVESRARRSSSRRQHATAGGYAATFRPRS